MSKYTYTDEEFTTAVESSLSIAEVCRKLGIKAVGGNYATVKNKITKLNLDISHFTGKAWNQGLRYQILVPAKSLEDILKEGGLELYVRGNDRLKENEKAKEE